MFWAVLLDPFNFDADPVSGFAIETNGSGSIFILYIYWFFLTEQNFKIFCFIFFFAIFMLKLHEPWTEQEFFINSLNSSDLGFESKYFSELFGWYFTPWICIYLWIRKSCGSNGSRSLGLVLRDFFMVLVHILPLGSGPRSRKPKKYGSNRSGPSGLL